MWVVSADRDNILVTWWERGMTKPEAKKEGWSLEIYYQLGRIICLLIAKKKKEQNSSYHNKMSKPNCIQSALEEFLGELCIAFSTLLFDDYQGYS